MLRFRSRFPYKATKPLVSCVVILVLVCSYLLVCAPASITSHAGPHVSLRKTMNQLEKLEQLVHRKGIVPDFGRKASRLMEQAAAQYGTKSQQMEKVVDARLHLLFKSQMQTLRSLTLDQYESFLVARPNPLEAAIAAQRLFSESAAALVRPGSAWSFEGELRDIKQTIAHYLDRDMQLIEEQGKQSQGKEVTMKVVQKLQEQENVVQRKVDTYGAFPWDVKWQYSVRESPLAFRGQYTQGRSIVEMLFMPSLDPKLKNSLLNRIGPLNLAVAFDMLR